MLGDLPDANAGVPDDSQAPVATRQFINRDGSPDRPGPAGWPAAVLARRAAIGAVAIALVLGLFVDAAQADSLDKQHKRLNHHIHQVKQEMSESSHAARKAAVSLTKAKAKLKRARSALHKTRHRAHVAAKTDAKLAAKLASQRRALAAAKKRVKHGKHQIAKQKKTVGAIARDGFQRNAGLARLAALTSSQSMGDLSNRIQMSDTMLDTNQAKFDRLTTLQRKLTKDQHQQSKLERHIAKDRAAAARNLSAKRRLAHKAKAQKAKVTKLVRKRRKAQAAADKAVAKDKLHYAKLRKENKAVEQRIAKRIAREKAEAARRAAARKAKARKKAAAQRRAAAERASAKRASHTSSKKHSKTSHKKNTSHKGNTASSKSTRSSGGKAAHHGFRLPVNGPVTSPYGMRMHPILHVYKLHDGTDFGVGCGTTMHAAYSGKVTERYHNPGYGNRLFIDHGKVDGSHITTVMNHAKRYVVHSGQHVKKGQVVGYVGSTGYSTGCHMHVMVYKNGKKINPMSWF